MKLEIRQISIALKTGEEFILVMQQRHAWTDMWKYNNTK